MQQRTVTAADAELILKLYDLRREPVMRKARDFVNGNLWPQSAEEVIGIAMAFGTEQNAYVRQVLSYWEMAASLVVRGALDAELFLDSNGEMLFTYAKLKPFLAQIRQQMNAPEFLGKVEQLVEGSERARTMLTGIEARVKMITQQMRQAAKTS